MNKQKRITSATYFSKANQMQYLGASQFKDFMQCEAAALARVRGEYTPAPTTALLVGSYVDAYFEGKLEKFEQAHPDIFTQTGELKSQYKQANNIISRAERDALFMRYMSGKKQVIKTGVIANVPFKSKIDSYHPGKCIVDLKVMKDFAPVWKAGQGHLNFIQAWGYDIQGAIYQAIEGNHLPFYIAAITKEPEPDLNVYHIPQPYLDTALELVAEYAPRFQAIKHGEIEPNRCGKCDYCKHTKVLTEIVSLEDLEYEYDG